MSDCIFDTETMACVRCGFVAQSLPAFKTCRGVAEPPRPSGSVVGTELSKSLSWLGIKEEPGCSCASRKAQLNSWSADTCEAHLNEIVSWLREEAAKRRLPFVDAVGRLLVKRAIRAARRSSTA